MSNHSMFASLKNIKMSKFSCGGNGYLFNNGDKDMNGDGIGSPRYFSWPCEKEKNRINRGCGDSFLNGDYSEVENLLIHPYESFHLSFWDETLSIDDRYDREFLFLTSHRDEM